MAFKKSQVIDSESIENYKTKQQTTQDRTVVRRTIDVSDKFDSIVGVFVGDWHIGSVDFDMDSAIDILNYTLNTPNAIMFCLGDMLNSAILNSVSDMFEDVAYPQEQWQVFVDLFKKVADQKKLAVIHTGNHERRIQKATGLDPVLQAAFAMNSEEYHAPYFSETRLVIKCDDSKKKKFIIPIISHHGDGGNPETFSNINKDSLINAMGHTHNFQIWVKSLIDYDQPTNRAIKKEELEIVIPANGGGLYGYAKGLRKIHKASYLALELTATKNPRYDFFKSSDVIEPEIVLATRSFHIIKQANTKEKQTIINSALKLIEQNKKITQIKVLAKIQEIVEILEQHGLECTKEIKKEITDKILYFGKMAQYPKKEVQLQPKTLQDDDDLQK